MLKHSAPSELLTAINSALKGRTYITPMLAGELLNYERNRPRGGEPEQGLARLTSRQREVLQLIAEGMKEAAALLGISARTVEFHKYSMMEALGLKSSAELMRFAVKHGMNDRATCH